MKKILIRDITPSGLNIEDTISQSLFEKSEEDYIQFIEPVSVQAVLRRFESTVLGDIKIKTRFESFCCRSLEKIQRDWAIRFSLDYEIEPYQETLDIEDDIRQEILLQLPLRILSDAEAAKEAMEIHEVPDEDQPPENTYKPFKGLKDLE
ncbi:MAG: DUF177 domain-containing protein [Candidatus Omnitrophota bacterium]